MKILTTILTVLFLLAAFLFGSILAKNIFGFLTGGDETADNAGQETVGEEQQFEAGTDDKEIETDSEHPCISPDNLYIAFNSLADGQSEIFIINIDGTGETRLTSIPGDDWGPAFMYQAH